MDTQLEQKLRYHHKQGCRHTLTRYISYYHAQMIVIYKIEIIEIPADLLGRCHGGIDLKFMPVREGRKYIGKDRRLYPSCDIQLGSYTLAFSCHGGDPVDMLKRILLHLPDGSRKHLYLGNSAHIGKGSFYGFRILHGKTGRLPYHQPDRPYKMLS